MSIAARILVTVLVAAAVAATAPAGTARACSCAEVSLADNDDWVVAAFVGMQTSRDVEDEVADNGTALTFEVERVYVGDVATRVEVRTHAQDSACGLDLDGRGLVGIAASEFRGELSVGLCGSVVPVDELEAIYGPGSDPATAAPTADSADTGDSSRPARVALASMLVAIVIASALIVVRRRRER